ncbi:MAG: alpha/beta hydrolase [Acidobacteriia bacterium]|nr:alpha/beta hydrolase [Terriglobia bacterium]
MKVIFTCGASLLVTCSILAAQATPVAPPGRMVNINGRKLHLNCAGKGSPTVVLEAGLGDSSLAWSLVQPKLATATRVCSYDRSGTAWSHDAGPQHGLAKAADDLDLVLRTSGEPPPYLLVGHSWGGWLITVYARRHLENVAGIVLVDSSVGFDPPVIEKMPESQVGGPPAGPLIMKKSLDEDDPFKKLPASARKAYEWTQSLKRFDDVDDPDEPLVTVQAATSGEFPLESKPLVLIAARRGGALGEETEEGKTIRSKVLSLSRHSTVVYANSGHHVQLEEPKTVIAAVREIIDRARHLQERGTSDHVITRSCLSPASQSDRALLPRLASSNR